MTRSMPELARGQHRRLMHRDNAGRGLQADSLTDTLNRVHARAVSLKVQGDLASYCRLSQTQLNAHQSHYPPLKTGDEPI